MFVPYFISRKRCHKITKMSDIFCFDTHFFLSFCQKTVNLHYKVEFSCMKKIFTIFGCALLAMSMVSCADNEENKPANTTLVTIDFEADALNDKVATNPATWTFMQEGYGWQDEVTSLKHTSIFTNDYGYPVYSGGLTLSRYNTSDVERFATYESDLYVYNSENADSQSGGGADGSDTFLVAYNFDPDVIAELDMRPAVTFADGVARRVVSCQVNSTAYFINIAENGNPFSPAMKDGEEIKIYATGYDATGREGKTVSMSFARKGHLIKQWTKWDLSQLGKVLTIKFNIKGGNTDEWGMTTPKYFAIDNIVVEQELKIE